MLRWLRDWNDKHGRPPTASEIACFKGLTAISEIAWMRSQGLIAEDNTITQVGHDTIRAMPQSGARTRRYV